MTDEEYYKLERADDRIAIALIEENRLFPSLRKLHIEQRVKEAERRRESSYEMQRSMEREKQDKLYEEAFNFMRRMGGGE